MTTTRRLAAILVADVVGYSRLMEADEAGTLSALKERRKTILEPVVKEHGGRIVKLMGDGVLVEFASAVKAVEAAIALQEKFSAANEGVDEHRRIVLRIGINLGDVIGEGSDIYGDGVNVAARLEALAEPGGLCISAKVYEEVRGRIATVFEDIGERQLKNIAAPVRAYVVKTGSVAPRRPALALPDRPSIAVLPFVNMSKDPEQEPFTDGLTEDLITDLSNVPDFFVIARNSTFAYKGRPTDVRQIARDLGVKYILEGSARRSDKRLRINVQLVDAAKGGNHVWAERFDRELVDVFMLQDELARRIIEAISGKLTPVQVHERYRPASLSAYEYCLRARNLSQRSKIASQESRALLERAIALDSDYSEAYWRLALCHHDEWYLWGENPDGHRAKSVALARRAITLDSKSSSAHCTLGHLLTYECRWDEAEAEFNQALLLNPNDADALALKSDFLVVAGNPNEALGHAERALRLNPTPPGWYYWHLGQAQIAAGQLDAAIETLRREETYRTLSRRILAAAFALSGRNMEAIDEAGFYMADNPNWSIGRWAATQPFRNPNGLQFWIDAFRLAGLPE